MKTNEYKILVLSNLKENSNQILSYATKLAHEIDAKVELLHVKDISEITQMENSIMVSKKINEIYNKMNKTVSDFAQPISEKNDIKIKTTFALGNLRNVIENHIKVSNPNMIILGQKTPKRFNWFSDNIIEFVHDIYDGVIFEATDADLSDKDGKVSLDNLGLQNNIENYNTSKTQKTAKV